MPTLEDLISLNDEVNLLANAGVPFDAQLMKVGQNRRHELTRINAAVARRVGRGEPLVDAVAAEDDSLPEVYQNMVEAGLRCGRLPAVLEGLCEESRARADLNRRLAVALCYPMLVAILAYALLIASLVYYLPMLVETYGELRVDAGPALRWCLFLHAHLTEWAAVPALLLFVLAVCIWQRGSRSTIGWQGWLSPLAALPGVSHAVQDSRHASTARLAALMLDNGVGLPDSLRLAAGVAGDRKLQSAIRNSEQSKLLPVLRWAIEHAQRDSTSMSSRVAAFQLAADHYHDRALRRSQRLRRVIPVITLVVLGGGMSLLYFLSVLGPFIQLIEGLVGPGH